MFSKIIVNSPWYFFLLSFVLGAGVAYWLYFRNKKNSEAPRAMLYLMFVLRFVSTFLVTLFLLNIFLKRLKNETENPIVLLAIDNSASMAFTQDSSYVKNGFISAIKNLKKNLQEKYEVKSLLFGSHSETSETNPDFSEKETDIENLISDIENNYSDQNIGALIIASDGIYNKGANPVYAGEKLMYPIYTIAMGDTNEVKDILIQKINYNQVTYSGNDFPVEVIVNAKKYNGKEVMVSLSENGAEKGKQPLKINSDNFLGTCDFTLNSGSPGILKYTAKVSLIDDEKNKTNNIQSFVIEVIDNKEKVLLLAANPHPDISAIKTAMEGSTNYEIEYGFATEFKKPLKAYSLVILHGFSSNQLQLLNDCRNNNIPYWIINPSTSENLPGIRLSGSLNRYNDAEPTIDASFGLFNLSNELKKFVGDLPAVKTFFGNYTMGNGTNVLLKQRIGAVETENPVLLFCELNGSKSAVFLGDGLWKWKFRDFSEHKNNNLFNELISKSIQYLSVKNDKSFFRIHSPKIINENMPVELGAEVYNKSYEPITEPDVTIVLTNPEKKKFNYTFSKFNNSYKLNIGILPPGEYSYQASVKMGNEILVKQGMFAVKEVISEKINTVANHQILFQLSRHSNGKLFYPRQTENLLDELLKSERIKPVTYSQTSTTSLIEFKWLFFLILVLLASEWFFRKRFLSI